MTKVSHVNSVSHANIPAVDGLVEGTPGNVGGTGLFGNLLGVFGQTATQAASIVSQGWLQGLATQHGVNNGASDPKDVIDTSPIADTVHGAENNSFLKNNGLVLGVGAAVALGAVVLIARG